MFRGNPWQREVLVPLTSLRDEINRWYENMRPIAPTPDEPTELAEATWVPPVDLAESGDSIHVWVDLPGIDPATIEVSVTGDLLTLKGMKPAAALDAARRHTTERPCGQFLRRLTLPAAVDVDAIKAECRQGVLSIALPKAAALRPRTIPIHPA